MVATATLIVLCVCLVYANTVGNDFVSWDDRKYIYENRLVTGDGGLGAIWSEPFNPKPRLHYYPLTFTTFWLEHRLVGLHPSGEVGTPVSQPAHPLYHVDQFLLHALNALLVLFVLRALGIGFLPASFAALAFALHPLNAASVAWVSERKNTLSTLFFLLSMLAYVTYRRRSAGSTNRYAIRWYLLSLGAFLGALLSKAASVTLAPSLILVDRLLDGRWTVASLKRVVPHFAAGVVMALITASREAHIAKAWDPIDFSLRPFVAASALVHYVLKALVPIHQPFIYERWPENLAAFRYWLSVVLVAAGAWLIWRYRRWLGDAWLWGLAFFLVNISLVLGFKHYATMQYSFVWDHFTYVAGIGIFLMLGLLIERLYRAGQTVEGGPGRRRWWVVSGCVVFLSFCGWRTVQQNETWQSNESLWTHTLSLNPDAWNAHMNLGNHFARAGNGEGALRHYQEWARLQPTWGEPRFRAARYLLRLGRGDEAVETLRDAIAKAEAKSRVVVAWRKQLAGTLAQLGRYAEAVAEYERLLAKKPSLAAQLQPRIDELRARL